MSKPLTLLRKFRIFWRYLKQRQDGVIVDCAFCHSINIHFETQGEEHVGDKIIYTSIYTCRDCHSTCQNHQVWERNF